MLNKVRKRCNIGRSLIEFAVNDSRRESQMQYSTIRRLLKEG